MLDQYQTELGVPQPEADISIRPINLDVRRRGFDPFFSGMAVGVTAMLMGLLLGVFFFLPV